MVENKFLEVIISGNQMKWDEKNCILTEKDQEQRTTNHLPTFRSLTSNERRTNRKYNWSIQMLRSDCLHHSGGQVKFPMISL